MAKGNDMRDSARFGVNGWCRAVFVFPAALLACRARMGFWMLLCALASGAASAGGSSGVMTVQAAQVDGGDQTLTITGATSWGNPDGCTTSAYVIVLPSNPFYKDIEAAVLTAGTAGKTVSFWLSGCTAVPWGGTAPIATAVSITF